MPVSAYVMEKMQSKLLESALKFSVVCPMVVIFNINARVFVSNSLPSNSHYRVVFVLHFSKTHGVIDFFAPLSIAPWCQNKKKGG